MPNTGKSVVGENVYIGSDVLLKEENGGVLVEEGARLDVKASKRVVIKNDFRCQQGGTLKIGK